MTQNLKVITSNEFREGMRFLTGAVCVVATDGLAGRHGITATAVSSVSAEPPSLLVCSNRENTLSQFIRINCFFSVNILTDRQVELSNTFAGFTDVDYPARFEVGKWERGKTGVLIESEALVSFECEADSFFAYGTHDVIFGKIVNLIVRQGNPLLYFNRRYSVLSALAD